jgi:hypothetical protein
MDQYAWTRHTTAAWSGNSNVRCTYEMVTGKVRSQEATFLGALSLICGTVVVLGSLRFFRRYLELKAERQRPIAVNGLSERLDRIDSAVESTSIEVERIAEANRFIAKLLAERSGAASLPSRPERVITPH